MVPFSYAYFEIFNLQRARKDPVRLVNQDYFPEDEATITTRAQISILSCDHYEISRYKAPERSQTFRSGRRNKGRLWCYDALMV